MMMERKSQGRGVTSEYRTIPVAASADGLGTLDEPKSCLVSGRCLAKAVSS